MSKAFCLIDDKHIPIFRVMWIADVPHFCGEEDCLREGQYEIRMEQEESVWGSREERDRMIKAIEEWVGEGREEP